MTNLLEKARAGRTAALKERATRNQTTSSIVCDRISAASERRKEVPFFISSRPRNDAHAFLH